MRTIFITSFFGLSARNILSTSILEILSKNPDLRVVILAPEEKKEIYQRNFASGRENVVVEGVTLKSAKVTSIKLQTASKSWLEKLLFSLAINASDTSSRRVIRMEERHNKNRYVQTFFHWVLAKLSNLKLFRLGLRYFDQRLLPKNKYSQYFEKYKPSLVFVTDVFSEHDVQVMREAKARKIKLIGMVRSWDNITSHGMNRIIPDKLIVNTPKIKEEAIKYNDVLAENIFVTGIPHYDRYTSEKRFSREEVFKKLNLDPNKKTIFFAPPSDIYTEKAPLNRQIIEELGQLKDVQVIVRLYLVGDINLEGIESIPNKLAIDAPNKSKHFIGTDLAPNADAHLADLLYHSDIVVAFASTLAIDGTVFEKPVILLGFDGEPRPYWRSLKQYYDFDHQKYLLSFGGVKLANSIEEFMKYIKSYLNNPSLDAESRKKVTEAFCWKLDGKSGERTANFLLNEL